VQIFFTKNGWLRCFFIADFRIRSVSYHSGKFNSLIMRLGPPWGTALSVAPCPSVRPSVPCLRFCSRNRKATETYL